MTYRAALIVADNVIIEIKFVQEIHPVHLTNY
ncbi:hypothetical protein [Psychroserpens sp.]